MWFCLVSAKASCTPFQSGDEAKIKHLHAILHKQSGEPYGGFCTCIVGLIYYWKKQLCLEKKLRKNKLTKVVYFTGGHTLPVGITSEYPNYENLVY